MKFEISTRRALALIVAGAWRLRPARTRRTRKIKRTSPRPIRSSIPVRSASSSADSASRRKLFASSRKTDRALSSRSSGKPPVEIPPRRSPNSTWAPAATCCITSGASPRAVRSVWHPKTISSKRKSWRPPTPRQPSRHSCCPVPLRFSTTISLYIVKSWPGNIWRSRPAKTRMVIGNASPADFGVLVPQDHTSMSVRMELIGKEKIMIRGAERDLLRLNLSGEDIQWEIWLDESDHFKLIRVAIPADNTVVDRD